MRTLWPIGSVSEETLLFLYSDFASSASEGVLLGAAERAKTFETKTTHLRHMRGLFEVLQDVTISLLSRVRLFPPSKAARPSLCPYSPKCVEGVFYELRLHGVLRSSPP